MQVTLKQLEALLPMVLKVGVVPFIKSSPAIGKSSLIHALAKQFKLKVIDIRLAECDPTDLHGFPYFDHETKKASYYPLNIFPTTEDKIPDGYNGWWLFFDELSNAPLSVQAACYKVILDRQVGQHKLHPNVFMCAAGNLETDNAAAQPISSALVSRFAIFEVKLNQKDWNEWAAGNGIDYRITSFMNFKPDHLYTFHPDTADKPYASPRTWAMLSRIIKDTKFDATILPVLASLIGEGVAREFMSFLELEKDMPTFEDILKNPENVEIKNDLSVKWSIMGMVAHKISPETVIPCTKFLNRFPDELRVVAIREIRLRHPNLLTESKDFSTWFNKVALETLS